MRYYSIIYEAIDDVKQMMSGMLQPEIKETIVGVAQVREVFRSSKFGVVAGCLVTEGLVKRNNPIRVLRDNVVIFEGALESLRRFKDEAGEVRAGTECGIGVKNYRMYVPTIRSSAIRAPRSCALSNRSQPSSYPCHSAIRGPSALPLKCSERCELVPRAVRIRAWAI